MHLSPSSARLNSSVEDFSELLVAYTFFAILKLKYHRFGWKGFRVQCSTEYFPGQLPNLALLIPQEAPLSVS